MQIFLYYSENVYQVMLCHEINVMKYHKIWDQNLKSTDMVNSTWYVGMFKSPMVVYQL